MGNTVKCHMSPAHSTNSVAAEEKDVLPLRRLSLYPTRTSAKNFMATSMNSWRCRRRLLVTNTSIPAVLNGVKVPAAFALALTGSDCFMQRAKRGVLVATVLQMWGILWCNSMSTPPSSMQTADGKRSRCNSCKNRHLVRPACVHSRPEFGASSMSGDGEL